jgi:MYXO-CTERM domain-containing protein
MGTGTGGLSTGGSVSTTGGSSTGGQLTTTGGTGSGGAPGFGGTAGAATGGLPNTTTGGSTTGGQVGLPGDPPQDAGCSCTVPARPAGGNAQLIAVLGAALALARRRNRVTERPRARTR